MVSRVRQVAVVLLFSFLAFVMSVTLLDGSDARRLIGSLLITGVVAVALTLFVRHINRSIATNPSTPPPTFAEILRTINAIIRGGKQ